MAWEEVPGASKGSLLRFDIASHASSIDGGSRREYYAAVCVMQILECIGV